MSVDPTSERSARTQCQPEASGQLPPSQQRKRKRDSEEIDARELDLTEEKSEIEFYTIDYTFDNPQSGLDFDGLEYVIKNDIAADNIRRGISLHSDDLTMAGREPSDCLSYVIFDSNHSFEVTVTSVSAQFRVESDEMFQDLHNEQYAELIATLIVCGASPSLCASKWECSSNTHPDKIPIDDQRGTGSSVWMFCYVPFNDFLAKMGPKGATYHSDMHEQEWIEWPLPHDAFKKDLSLQVHSSLTSDVEMAYIYRTGHVRLRTSGENLFVNPVIEKLHMRELLHWALHSSSSMTPVSECNILGFQLIPYMKFCQKNGQPVSLHQGHLIITRNILNIAVTTVMSRKGRCTFYLPPLVDPHPSVDKGDEERAMTDTYTTLMFTEAVESRKCEGASMEFVHQHLTMGLLAYTHTREKMSLEQIRKIADLEQTVFDLEETVSDLEKTVSDLGETVSGQNSQIDKLQKQVTSMDDTRLCFICRENPRNAVIQPCRHVVGCEDCLFKIYTDDEDDEGNEVTPLCPICKGEFDDYTVLRWC